MKFFLNIPAILAIACSAGASPIADPDASRAAVGIIANIPRVGGHLDVTNAQKQAIAQHNAGGLPVCQVWYHICQRWAALSSETASGKQMCTIWAQTCGWRDGKPPPPKTAKVGKGKHTNKPLFSSTNFSIGPAPIVVPHTTAARQPPPAPTTRNGAPVCGYEHREGCPTAVATHI